LGPKIFLEFFVTDAVLEKTRGTELAANVAWGRRKRTDFAGKIFRKKFARA
jgi:hypothetical protein